MSKNGYLCILIMLASFAAVCALLYTPALPQVASYLKISSSQAQQSISIFLIGYALGFLPWGPLANDIGRKKTTHIGLALAAFGLLSSMMIVIYPKLWLLNCGRLLTALGSSVGIKITYTYIADLFTKEEILSKISYLLLASAAASSLAVAAGGLITSYLGWLSCFYVTFGYGVLLLNLSFFLPETLTEDKKIPIDPLNLLRTYACFVKNTALIKSSFMMGCCTAFTYLFASMAPFILIQNMGLSPKDYGLYNFIPASGIIAGFYAIQFFKTKLASIKQIKYGMLVAAFFTAALTFLLITHKLTSLSIFLSMAGLYLGISIVFANASSLALSTTTDKSNASSTMNFLNMSLCCLTLFIDESFSKGPELIMISSYVILICFVILMWWLLKNDQKIQELSKEPLDKR